MSEAIVIRHGETEWNVEWRQQGHLDSALTPLGEQQARAAGNRLKNIPYSALYSSDLGRALTTAEIIGEITGHEVISDERLRERHLGRFQGLTLDEAQSQFPEDYELYRAGDPDFKLPNGESRRQRYERNIAAMEDLARKHPEQRIVVVGHGGLLDSMMCHALGLSLSAPRRYKLYNASLNTFYFQKGIWILGAWGDLQHLDELGSKDDNG